MAPLGSCDANVGICEWGEPPTEVPLIHLTNQRRMLLVVRDFASCRPYATQVRPAHSMSQKLSSRKVPLLLLGEGGRGGG